MQSNSGKGAFSVDNHSMKIGRVVYEKNWNFRKKNQKRQKTQYNS